MSERPSPDLPPERRPRRDPPRSEGPFDRALRRRPERDPAPLIIGGTVAFVAVVIALVLVFSSVLDDNGGGSGLPSLPAGIEGRIVDPPPLPPGLKVASKFVEFESVEELAVVIELPLQSGITDAATLGFYTFLDTRWERVADVNLVDDGARGAAEFSSVPSNLAILRVAAKLYDVAGSLPAGGSLHPEAVVDIVSPRDYAPAADGSVLGTPTQIQGGSSVLLIPTIVGGDEGARAIVDAILADELLRADHIQAIAALAEEGGFDGIDLEYSSVDPSLQEAFTEFVTGLGVALRQNGMRLSLSLPPPRGEPQAYNWPVLGEVADTIKLLPIADPLEYWATMPDALSQIVEDVDPGKVMLVVSPLSVERVGSVTRFIGYRQAMLLASEVAVREPGDPGQILPGVSVELVAVNLVNGEGRTMLHWSDDAAAVTFTFGGAQSRTIFLANSFSVGFKLEMVQAHGLAGLAVSDASAQSDVANIWPAVNDLVEAAAVSLVRPNDDALLPRWQAPDGGDLEPEAGTTSTWIAPAEEGEYVIVLAVSDGENRFGQEITVKVNPGPTLTPTPTSTATPTPTGTPTPTPTGTPTPAPTATASPTPGASPSPTPTPTATPGGTPPDQVTGLEAIPGGASGKITLVWNPILGQDVDHYNIWRGTASGGLYPFVASVPVGLTLYTNSDLEPGTTYCYVVTAVNSSGNVGPPADEACSEPTQ